MYCQGYARCTNIEDVLYLFSNQVHSSADTFESFAAEEAFHTHAQGIRYLRFTLPFNSAPSGDVPAHSCVKAPYEGETSMAA